MKIKSQLKEINKRSCYLKIDMGFRQTIYVEIMEESKCKFSSINVLNISKM